MIFQTNGGECCNRMSERPQLLHKTIDLVFVFFGRYSNILLVITRAKGIALLRNNISHVSVGCVIKASQLMLYGVIIAVCSQIHTKHINTLFGQNVELLNVKLAVYKDPVRTAQ